MHSYAPAFLAGDNNLEDLSVQDSLAPVAADASVDDIASQVALVLVFPGFVGGECAAAGM